MKTIERKLIGHELRCTSNLLKRHVDERLEKAVDHPLTSIQGAVLGYVAHNPEKEIFQRDIEAEFKMKRSSASEILQLMEKNGLLTRCPVEHDARLKRIVLTEKALQYHRQIEQTLMQTDELIIQKLGEQEIEHLFSVLEKIREIIYSERKDITQ